MRKEVFNCAEETPFYSYCLQSLVLPHTSQSDSLLELGVGGGSPVINAVKASAFSGVIHGYEINDIAYREAEEAIANAQLGSHYRIYLESFFTADRPESSFIISSTPYIPAPDDNIYLPGIYGGPEGNTIAKQLIDLDYETVFLLFPSYANPLGFLDYCDQKGYGVSRFLASPMSFGYYSSEPRVKEHIAMMKSNGKAFYLDNTYLVAGIVFEKTMYESEDNLMSPLRKVMRSLSD